MVDNDKANTARHQRRPAPQLALRRLRHLPGLDHLQDRRQLRGDRRARSRHRLDAPTSSTQIEVRAANGKLVPLSAFAEIERTAGLLSVNQIGQLPAVTISFNLPDGVSLGQATGRIEAIRAELNLPPTLATSFVGTAQVFEDAVANQGLLLARRRAHHLHRARHPLRELHPPAHHPDRAAGGGGRGAAHAPHLRLRPQRHRHHRHPDADRHRQEERDHDDRLRAGASARRRDAVRRRSARPASSASGRS